MHRRLAQLDTTFGIFRSQMFRWFQAYMLYWIRKNLWPYDRLDGVKQLFIAQAVEDCRSDPKQCVLLHASLWQREIEILGVDCRALFVDFDQRLAERQIGIGGRNFPFCIEFA